MKVFGDNDLFLDYAYIGSILEYNGWQIFDETAILIDKGKEV